MAEMQLDTLTARLLERRISLETISTFEIEPRATGWEYPTRAGVRHKNYDSTSGPKYWWEPGRSESADAPYYASDLAEHVSLNGGLLWYASGEPDVWALRSAGIPHAFCSFTEKKISRALVAFLQSLGVTILNIAPDLDDTGALWARKIATALHGSGIELDCRQLPASLGEHGDIGKAWQQYTRRAPFERYLLGLPRWYPEPERPVLLRPVVYSSITHVPQEFQQKIMDALGVESFNGSGFSNKILCPFHPEKRPSADVIRGRGVYCFHDMRFHTWKETAAALGIEWTARVTRTKATDAPSEKEGLIVGLAVEAKLELVKRKLTPLARVLDVYYSHGGQGGEYTASELSEACPELPTWTIRAALEFLRELSTSYSLSPKEQDKHLKNYPGREGRPLKRHFVPSIQALYSLLNVEPRTWLALPAQVLQNAAQYRRELTAVPVRVRAGRYARKQLAAPLGISPRTVTRHFERTDIEITPQFERADLTEELFAKLPVDVDDQRRRRSKAKFRVWLENAQGKRFAANQASALYAGWPGQRLEFVKQLANFYRATS